MKNKNLKKFYTILGIMILLIGIACVFLDFSNPETSENNSENLILYKKCLKINSELANSCAEIDAFDENNQVGLKESEEAKICFQECLE